MRYLFRPGVGPGEPARPERLAPVPLDPRHIARALWPTIDAPFPAWQGMQYVGDISSGRGTLSPLDNARYCKTDWTRAEAVLAPTV